MKRWYLLVKLIVTQAPILIGDLKMVIAEYYKFCKDLREIFEGKDTE